MDAFIRLVFYLIIMLIILLLIREITLFKTSFRSDVGSYFKRNIITKNQSDLSGFRGYDLYMLNDRGV